jgi:hypothetical protein
MAICRYGESLGCKKEVSLYTMKIRRFHLKYRTASAVCTVLGIMGLAVCGCLYLFETVNTGFVVVAILALGLVAAGIAVKIVFYRCSKCSGLLPLRTFVTPSYCPYCGVKLDNEGGRHG